MSDQQQTIKVEFDSENGCYVGYCLYHGSWEWVGISDTREGVLKLIKEWSGEL
jgi:hypothetical protein